MCGACSSAGEHYVDIVGVTGSIPVASTIPFQDIHSVEETALGRSNTRVCYSGLLPNPPNGPLHRIHGHLSAVLLADRQENPGVFVSETLRQHHVLTMTDWGFICHFCRAE